MNAIFELPDCNGPLYPEVPAFVLPQRSRRQQQELSYPNKHVLDEADRSGKRTKVENGISSPRSRPDMNGRTRRLEGRYQFRASDSDLIDLSRNARPKVPRRHSLSTRNDAWGTPPLAYRQRHPDQLPNVVRTARRHMVDCNMQSTAPINKDIVDGFYDLVDGFYGTVPKTPTRSKSLDDIPSVVIVPSLDDNNDGRGGESCRQNSSQREWTRRCSSDSRLLRKSRRRQTMMNDIYRRQMRRRQRDQSRRKSGTDGWSRSVDYGFETKLLSSEEPQREYPWEVLDDGSRT